MCRRLIVLVAVILSAALSHTCVGQGEKSISGTDPTLTYLLPAAETELIGGTITKVSVRLELSPNTTEAVEYKAQLTVNGRACGPFIVELLPGASGTAVATWYVCVTSPDFKTHVRLSGIGKDSGKVFDSVEMTRTFEVTAILACRCRPSLSQSPKRMAPRDCRILWYRSLFRHTLRVRPGPPCSHLFTKPFTTSHKQY
jgi:hypothetical protein